MIQTPKLSHAPLSRQQEARIDQVPAACRVLTWSRPANRNRLSKKEHIEIMFINRPIYGSGSSLMCQADTMGTSGVIQHCQPALAKGPVLSAWV